MKLDRPCPFCNTEGRGILAENASAFLTYSIAPYAPDHLLICTKRHIEYFADLTEEEHADIVALQKIGFALLRKLGRENVTLLYREGKGTGKSIDHIHYHLIPEAIVTAPTGGADRPVMTEEEISKLMERFRMVI